MNNIKLAQNIKNICKEKKVTVSDLLEKCNLNKNFIYFMEKKNVSPTTDSLYKLADFLKIEVSQLFTEHNNEEKEEPSSKTLTFENKNQIEMLDIFNKLNEEYQKKAISQVFDLLIEMCRKQDEELNSKKAYIAAFGGGVFEIDDETAKLIEENAVFKKYKRKKL